MREYFTEAVVLESGPAGSQDRFVDLYTREFGRLRAKVVGGRKITSKLSPHLEKGNLVEVRLVEKNRFTVADVISKKRFGKNLAVFEVLFLLKSLLPELVSDLRLWHGLLHGLRQANPDKKVFLKLLGYNSIFAVCDSCGAGKVKYFSAGDQVFLCEKCSSRIRSHRIKIISI